ncbi:hypothetical protein TrCOL_g9240 [Triparma columacea]|uniref:Uncharacterized protein n=1 Tax=Triparma columacea TaxID=722753 RepID=A0A9W7LBU7_9STRA|nr:hypothetical protein TrCOL_g9240 [Triparma columacea]
MQPLLRLQNFTCVCLPGRRLVLSGVEKVLDGGSATDAVKLCGFKPPRYFWYCVSGTVCDVVQLALDLSFQVVGIEDPSINWMLSFFFSIIFRHTTHRYLVFGEYNGTYYESLVRMYISYTFIVLLSTVFNVVMVRTMKLSWIWAWLITLVWTGVVNYFIIKQLWGVGGELNGAGSEVEATTDRLVHLLTKAIAAGRGRGGGKKMKRDESVALLGEMEGRSAGEEGSVLLDDDDILHRVGESAHHRSRIETGNSVS